MLYFTDSELLAPFDHLFSQALERVRDSTIAESLDLVQIEASRESEVPFDEICVDLFVGVLQLLIVTCQF